MNYPYIQKIARTLEQFGLDALLVAPSEDMQLLIGARPFLCARFQGLVIKQDGDVFYICNVLSRDEMRELLDVRTKIYVWWDHEGFVATTRTALAENGLLGAKIGVSGTVRAYNALTIAEQCGVHFADGRAVLEYARMIKTPAQMQELRTAALVADRALERLKGELRPGLIEKDITDMLVAYMAEQGATGCMAMACAGSNSAYPHYFGNSRELRHAEPLLLDFGCAWGEMRSDTSRTLFIGEVDSRHREIYEIVLNAQLAAEAAAVVGAYVPDIDRAARDVIAGAGYGEYFLTRTGHGIGVAMHEAPYITQTNDMRLEVGMAFSIEPGIYIAGDIGVRIEDVVLIGPEGTEILNKTSKELTVAG